MYTKILFWGDSITDGGRLKGKENAWDLNHQIGHCYAYLVSAKLSFEYPERHYTFWDRGISGFRLIDLYGRIEEDVLDLRPDCVSILAGVNDCYFSVARGESLDGRRFVRHYRLILEELRERLPQAGIVLCEPFILPVGQVKEQLHLWERSIKAAQKGIPALAQEFGATFIPLQQPFHAACALREPEYWSWDGIHPTVSGHGLIAKAWCEACITN